MDKKSPQSFPKLTIDESPSDDETLDSKAPALKDGLANTDSRIKSLVRLLARRAARHDYAQLLLAEEAVRKDKNERSTP